MVTSTVQLGSSAPTAEDVVAVARRGGRHVARLVDGLLRAQLIRADADGCRIGLLATTALLLGGDQVDLDVSVGPGASLDLFDVAGTVAYHGRGRPAGWRVSFTLAESAVLRYAGEPFIDVMPPGSTPDTRSVRASNIARIAVHRPGNGDTVTIIVVEDNLVKGAAGQAVQNMNLMFGLPETAGLTAAPVLP